MVYDLTNMTNASNLMGMAQASNSILGGYYFGNFVILILWFVVFIVLKQKGYVGQACFAVASWAVMFVAIILYAMTLVAALTMWTTVFLVSASVFILFISGNPD